jgi:hypothetical protein
MSEGMPQIFTSQKPNYAAPPGVTLCLEMRKKDNVKTCLLKKGTSDFKK